jgi:hypothetical protein
VPSRESFHLVFGDEIGDKVHEALVPSAAEQSGVTVSYSEDNAVKIVEKKRGRKPGTK